MKSFVKTIVILLVMQNSAYAASAGDRALAWAEAQRDAALGNVAVARNRVDAAESDLKISRNVEADIRNSKDKAALSVAQEAVAVSEQSVREARTLLQKASQFLAMQDRTLTSVRNTVANFGNNRAILIPGQGDVRIAYKGGRFNPDTAEPLSAGTRIEVGKGGSAHLFVAGGDAEIALSQNTSFTMTLDDAEGGFEATLDRGFGRIRSLIHTKFAQKFEVRTPSAVTSVRGTDFSVAVLPDGSRVEVFKGVVNVQPMHGGDPVDVSAGHGDEVMNGGGTRLYQIPLRQMRENPWNDKPASN